MSDPRGHSEAQEDTAFEKVVRAKDDTPAVSRFSFAGGEVSSFVVTDIILVIGKIKKFRTCENRNAAIENMFVSNRNRKADPIEPRSFMDSLANASPNV